MVTIRVLWDETYNNGETWNNLLSWCIDTYGLPGNKVTFHPAHDFMDFVFKTEEDALIFQLRSGGFRRDDNCITVDYIGSMING